MAYGQSVLFGSITFPGRFCNKITYGGAEVRVKTIGFPGVRGVLPLNMRNAAREIRHSGVIRVSTEASLNSFVSALNTHCDGTLRNISFHGQQITSVFANSVNYGTRYAAFGKGGGSTAGTYFGLSFDIVYTDINRS